MRERKQLLSREFVEISRSLTLSDGLFWNQHSLQICPSIWPKLIWMAQGGPLGHEWEKKTGFCLGIHGDFSPAFSVLDFVTVGLKSTFLVNMLGQFGQTKFRQLKEVLLVMNEKTKTAFVQEFLTGFLWVTVVLKSTYLANMPVNLAKINLDGLRRSPWSQTRKKNLLLSGNLWRFLIGFPCPLHHIGMCWHLGAHYCHSNLLDLQGHTWLRNSFKSQGNPPPPNSKCQGVYLRAVMAVYIPLENSRGRCGVHNDWQFGPIPPQGTESWCSESDGLLSCVLMSLSSPLSCV